MPDSTPPSVLIRHDDLRVAAEAMLLRLPLRTPESRRVAHCRALLDASAELARLMAAHTHCGRVQSQGSHGTGDLVADTEALYAALAAFADLVHDFAGEYRLVVDRDVEVEVPRADVPSYAPAVPPLRAAV
jgi:hypothetical protein